MPSLLGTKVLRLEDKTLLTGEGQYSGDIHHEGCLEALFVSSTSPHAKLLSIDIAQALKVDGVVGIFTAETLELGKIAERFPTDEWFLPKPLIGGDAGIDGAEGSVGTVRFVGEPIAIILAETKTAAKDAAELVVVDYEDLPVRVDARNAFGGDEVRMYPDREDGDTTFFRFGQVENLHSEAEVVVTACLENNRMAVVPMETHAMSVVPPALNEDGRLVVWLSTQGSHESRRGIAASLEMEEDQVRVISPWVGGGFGAKGGWSGQHIAVARAACLLNRPVRWVEERSENLLSMQARHQIQYVKLGAKKSGEFTSLEVFLIADAGAYVGLGGMIPMGTRFMAQGVYKIPQIQFDFAAACTNKTPLGAFRGAGRPQASALLERMVDLAAQELEMDPVEIRRLNLLPKDAFPVQTQTGITYDTGDFATALDLAMEKADYASLKAEQKERRQNGDTKFLGIGMCCYVEITGGVNSFDYGSVEINSDGTATIRVGTSSHGQGHETAFSMIVAEELGIDIEDIKFLQADTDEVPHGQGTGGSRSAQIGGSAVLQSAQAVLEQAKELAAHLLEANPEDIAVSAATNGGTNGSGANAADTNAGLEVAGSPTTRLSWKELATAIADPSQRPETMADRLFNEGDFTQENATFPFGTHIAVVEIDSLTGKVELLRHIAVDDCGRILNPMLVEGQQHGGMSSGISQALYENVVYDESGNPRTTNLAEYLMPSAAEFPNFETYSTETPTHLNPLGVKGIGESGTVGATPAVQNAVVDAVAHLGIRHIDMPLTPEKVWRAIRDAQAGKLPDLSVEWPDFAAPDSVSE